MGVDDLARRMLHIGELLRKIVGVKKLIPGFEYSSRTIRASISPLCLICSTHSRLVVRLANSTRMSCGICSYQHLFERLGDLLGLIARVSATPLGR